MSLVLRARAIPRREAGRASHLILPLSGRQNAIRSLKSGMQLCTDQRLRRHNKRDAKSSDIPYSNINAGTDNILIL